MASDDYQLQFRALQTQFLKGLEQREQALRTAVTKQDVHAQLHRLAGAAGIYGYTALGDSARALMHRLDGIDLAALTTEINEMCTTLRALSQTVPNDTI